MEPQQKRMMTFLALALPIWIGTLFYMQYTQEASKPLSVDQPSDPGTGELAPVDPGASPSQLVPVGDSEVTTAPSQPAPTAYERPKDVSLEKVSTESFEIEFSPAGGVPVSWKIIDPKYAIRHEGEMLLDEDADGNIPLIDPALDPEGLDRPLEIVLKEQHARFYNELNQRVYEVNRTRAEIEDRGEHEILTFTSPVTDTGIQLVKTYRIPVEGYLCEVTMELVNSGSSRLMFNNEGLGLGVTLGPGLGVAPTGGAGRAMGQYLFTQPFYMDSEELESPRLKEGKPVQTPADSKQGIAWAGIHSRYFMMGIVPKSDPFEKSGFVSIFTKLEDEVAAKALASESTLQFYPRVEAYGTPFTVDPGQTARFDFELFAGPKHRDTLEAAGPDFDEILFHGSYRWFRALCFLLMRLLEWFDSILGSWGLAIIFLVITIRLITFPLTQLGMKQQAKSQQQMAKLKPQIDKINEKYKDDPQKKSQATMKLYQDNGVNPFGAFKGCLPMIIQLPIFFALYRILGQSIDLRGAGFLWIDDLSQSDRLFALGFAIPFTSVTHFNLLPLLTSATQVLVSWMSMRANPAMMENPMQKQMMYMMPVMILFFTYSFPAGLVLYWFVSNIWQLVQQQVVNKKILKPPTPSEA